MALTARITAGGSSAISGEAFERPRGSLNSTPADGEDFHTFWKGSPEADDTPAKSPRPREERNGGSDSNYFNFDGKSSAEPNAPPARNANTTRTHSGDAEGSRQQGDSTKGNTTSASDSQSLTSESYGSQSLTPPGPLQNAGTNETQPGDDGESAQDSTPQSRSGVFAASSSKASLLSSLPALNMFGEADPRQGDSAASLKNDGQAEQNNSGSGANPAAAQMNTATKAKPQSALNAQMPSPAVLPVTAPQESDLPAPELFSSKPDSNRFAGQPNDSPSWGGQTDQSSNDGNEPRVDAQDADPSDTTGSVAFEAKLSPITEGDSGAAAPSAKPLSGWSSVPADAAAAQPEPVASAVKVETASPANSVAESTSVAPQARPKTAATEEPAASRMHELIETPARPASANNALNLNVTGANVRFVERGGEIHVSVRTPDADFAHDLRSGLNDLAGSLQHAGIRTEVSSAPAGESSTRRDAQQTSPDSRGSGQQQPDAERGQERDPRQNRWQEAFADSFAANQEQSL